MQCHYQDSFYGNSKTDRKNKQQEVINKLHPLRHKSEKGKVNYIAIFDYPVHGIF